MKPEAFGLQAAVAGGDLNASSPQGVRPERRST